MEHVAANLDELVNFLRSIDYVAILALPCQIVVSTHPSLFPSISISPLAAVVVVLSRQHRGHN
jgi:hypothetical protein